MNAIIYTRVSTDEQADRGFSLSHQKEVLERYCQLKSVNIVKHFQEDYSAKTFDRPEWTDLESFCKANRMDIDVVLFTKWDRFSRNAPEAYQVLSRFHKLGISINSVEQPLDLEGSPEAKLMLAFYLAAPEVENDKRSKNVIEGTRRAMKDGYWPSKVPFGYKRCKINGKASIEPSHQAYIVQWIFERYSSGQLGYRELLIELKRFHNIKMSKTNLLALLRRKTYISKTEIPAYKKEPAQLVDSIHKPLISLRLFNLVQDIMDGKSPAKYFKAANDRFFPLRGHLECHSCGKPLTASRSKGRSKHYEYYHCQKPCGTRFKKHEPEEAMKQLLQQISLPEEILNLTKAVVQEYFDEGNKTRIKKIDSLTIEKLDIEQQLENAEELLFEGKLSSAQYERGSSKRKERLSFIDQQLEDLKDHNDQLLQDLNLTADLLMRPGYYFEEADEEGKALIVGSIFPEKLVFDGEAYRTALLDPIFDVIRSGNALFTRDLGNKKGTHEMGALLSWPNSSNIEPIDVIKHSAHRFARLVEKLNIAA